MDLAAIKKFLEENKDKDDIKAFLGELSRPNLQGVQGFLESDEDAKKWLQSQKDAHFNKGLDTWKTNNLSKLVDEEINKRFPEESEEKKMLKKIQAELETEKNARVREALKNKAISIATEKGLPIKLVEYFVGQDEDSTVTNLGSLESNWQSALQKAVEAKFKEHGRIIPPAGGGGGGNTDGIGKKLAEQRKQSLEQTTQNQDLYFK